MSNKPYDPTAIRVPKVATQADVDKLKKRMEQMELDLEVLFKDYDERKAGQSDPVDGVGNVE